MQDCIVRAVAGDGAIRAFFAYTKHTVESARKIHLTTPTATAAFGRLLTGTVMMGQMLKNEKDLLTLQIKGDGAIEGILATSANDGYVKGYVNNPTADAPLKQNGKLNVSEVVGNGTITVIKDMGLKEPYVGQLPLVSGEIAEDLTSYFAYSEQTPSIVSLGVLIDTDCTVKQSGGYIIQLLPFADDDIIDALEKKMKDIKSVTEMLEQGLDAEGMLMAVLGDFGVEMTSQIPVSYHCNCDKKRVEKVLLCIGKDEIKKILDEDKRMELSCHFCGSKYEFDENDLINLCK